VSGQEPTLRCATLAIHDIDGTIIDSNDAHAHAWVRALVHYGRTVTFCDVRMRIGMGGDKLLQQVANIDGESDEGHQISAMRRSIFANEYLPSLRPTRGARRMIEWLRGRRVGIAIATSAEADEVTVC
jgi:beta-phosphoglucomutase-like phosphatase (HAD superfamily)